MNVETILRAKGRHVATISPEETIAVAARELAARGIGALIVSDDGESVAGILSERDVVHGLADQGASLLQQKVGDIMTRRVVTCSPSDSIEDLMSLMTQKRIRHLPCVENGKLCGIVSIGDVVKNRLDEVEYEASSLRSFIAQA
jgi:CBS domain-containing protein